MYGVPSDEIDKIEFQYQRSRNEGRKCKARSKENGSMCVRVYVSQFSVET